MRLSTLLPSFCWMCLTVLGMSRLWDYGSAPGEVAAPPARWPAEASLVFDAGRPNMLVFAHPRCPCTRASLRELERLLARAGGQASVRVLFVAPPGSAPGFTDGELWDAAVGLPGVSALRDVDGRLAARFGAHTSGQTLVYDGAGRLTYAGGLTGTRGHEGDNAGARAALQALRDESCGAGPPALGCSLRAPGEAPTP